MSKGPYDLNHLTAMLGNTQMMLMSIQEHLMNEPGYASLFSDSPGLADAIDTALYDLRDESVNTHFRLLKEANENYINLEEGRD